MKEQKNLTIVGYESGNAVIENEYGDTFYYEMPEEFAIIGEILIDADESKLKRRKNHD